MTTMYKTIASEKTAEGTPLGFYVLFDLFSNDWGIIGGTQDLELPEDSIPSATTPTWTDLQTIWFEMPVYAIDATFDDLEAVMSLRVEAKVDSQPDCNLRLANAAESITGTAVAMTDTPSYVVQPLMSLVWPAASIPTGRTEIKIQGQWNSDPGSKTLFTRRNNAALVGNCEFFIRVAT